MTDELPPLSKHDHPECRTMVWSALEMQAMRAYAAAAVKQEREAVIAKILRCRYPVCTSIRPSGYGWDEPRLNEAVAAIRKGGVIPDSMPGPRIL